MQKSNSKHHVSYLYVAGLASLFAIMLVIHLVFFEPDVRLEKIKLFSKQILSRYIPTAILDNKLISENINDMSYSTLKIIKDNYRKKQVYKILEKMADRHLLIIFKIFSQNRNIHSDNYDFLIRYVLLYFENKKKSLNRINHLALTFQEMKNYNFLYTYLLNYN